MAPFLLANFLATLHFVFYLWGELRPLYRYGTICNSAGKLAKRNGAIILPRKLLELLPLYPSSTKRCIDNLRQDSNNSGVFQIAASFGKFFNLFAATAAAAEAL